MHSTTSMHKGRWAKLASDIYLRIFVNANATNAVSVIGDLARRLGGGGLLNSLGNLAFGFKNLGTAGTIGMDAIKQGAMGLLANLSLIAIVLAAVAAAASIYIGVIAVRAAADFQQGLNRLVTGAGDVTDNMTRMGQAILGVSVDTGKTTGDLLKAMYLIISSGQRGAQALDTLSVAAKGAVIEQANVVDVANVLSGVMTNYGTHTFNATQFMNGLIRAVQLGKITLQQLAVAMGPIDPIAKSVGVSFSDLAAAMTTQTNAMVPAQRAATGLRFMMLALENPTEKAKAAMAALGLNSVDVALEMKKSLPGALQLIYDTAKKAGPEGSVPFNRAIADMVGGIRSFTAFTALTGPHMKDFVKNAAAILAAMNASKTAVMGWDVAQSNFNVQMDRAKAALQALLITIGLALLPVMTAIVMKIVPLVVAFTQWVIQSHAVQNVLAALGVILSTIGTVMGPVIVATLWFLNILGRLVTWVKNNETAMQAFKIVLIALGVTTSVMLIVALLAFVAVLAVVAAAIAVVIGIIMAVITVVRHWGDIMHWFGGIFSAVGTFIHDRIVWIGGVFNAFGTFIHDKLLWIYNHNKYVKAFVDLLVIYFNDMKNKAGAAFSAMGTFIHDRLTWIHDRVTEFKNAVGATFDALGSAIHQKITDAWNWLKGFVSGWPSQAFQWGVNLIQGLINGIGSMFSSLWNTVSNIASTIAGFLGFHSPTKLGPGREADTWMPNMMKMLTTGITAGTPGLHAALGHVMAPLGGGGVLMGGRGASTSVRSTGPVTLNVYVQQLDPREADRVIGYMADKLRAQMGNV